MTGYLTAELPTPVPDDDDAPFWAHCNQRRLTFQQCPRCATVVHPPLAVCPGCRGTERGWRDAPAAAVLFSFTWAHTAAHPSVQARLPYNIALVEFPALPGVRLISNVVDAAPGELRIGQPLHLVWEEGWQGQLLPRFRLARPTP